MSRWRALGAGRSMLGLASLSLCACLGGGGGGTAIRVAPEADWPDAAVLAPPVTVDAGASDGPEPPSE